MSRRFLLALSLCVFACTLLGTTNGALARPPVTVIRVSPADAPTLKKAIAAEKGHVVLVDFWATWCGPCMAEFPELVKLHRKYQSKGLVVFTVSADSTRDIKSKVVPFLQKKRADFPQYLERADDPEDFINAFDPHWDGDLPRTFLYDRHGHLVKEFGEQTPKGFEKALKPLLAKR